MKQFINLYYVGSKGINFGDSINPIIFERLLNIPVKRSYPTNADVIGTGSILHMLQLRNIIRYKKYLYFLKYNSEPIITFGCGFNTDCNTGLLYKTYRSIQPILLRGKMTHKVLEKINNTRYNYVSYGDLGLLIAFLSEKTPEKKYELGIIPHAFDHKNEKTEILKTLSKNHIVIDLRDNPLETLNNISKCETIISSSLHGLIAADSLNIPNKRFKFSNHGHFYNVDFKFNDYYSIYDKTPEYIDLTDDISCEKLKQLTPESISNDYIISQKEVEKYKNIILQKGKELKNIFS